MSGVTLLHILEDLFENDVRDVPDSADEDEGPVEGVWTESYDSWMRKNYPDFADDIL